MTPHQALSLVMEIAALKREIAIQEYQINANMEMFDRILTMTHKDFPEAHADIVALFEQDIREREDAMGADDVADALGHYDAANQSAGKESGNLQGGVGTSGGQE